MQIVVDFVFELFDELFQFDSDVLVGSNLLVFLEIEMISSLFDDFVELIIK